MFLCCSVIFFQIMLLTGKKSNAQCINGICTTLGNNPDGCQEICGKPSCSDAIVTKPCDLTNQLGKFTGDEKIYVHGKPKPFSELFSPGENGHILMHV